MALDWNGLHVDQLDWHWRHQLRVRLAYAYPGTGAAALERLDEAYARWIAGVRGLGEEGLARPCGEAEGAFAKEPMATLVLHIHREMIHHGAEISLLRDLYAHRTSQG